ncbi:MAG: hypothetical protein ACE5FT_04215 [Candidatus Nanoarchaeia archaeon]
MNTTEYALGLLAIFVLVGSVGIVGSGTGLTHLQGTIPYLSESGWIGEGFAEDMAAQCGDAMRYAGRQYSTYVRCCYESCTEPCKEVEGDVSDCVKYCGIKCQDIMTQSYLSRKPGTWR